MHKQFAGFVTLLGRLLITPIFAIAAYKHIADFAGTKGGAAHGFAQVGIILPDGVLTVMTVITCGLLVVGSLCLLLGWQAKFGALCLVAFLIGVTCTIHAFWTYPAAEQGMQLTQFEKNIAILGGLLFIMAYGAGPVSMDAAKAERRK